VIAASARIHRLGCQSGGQFEATSMTVLGIKSKYAHLPDCKHHMMRVKPDSAIHDSNVD